MKDSDNERWKDPRPDRLTAAMSDVQELKAPIKSARRIKPGFK